MIRLSMHSDDGFGAHLDLEESDLALSKEVFFERYLRPCIEQIKHRHYRKPIYFEDYGCVVTEAELNEGPQKQG